MAESSDPLLLSKKATRLLKGSDGLAGTFLVSQTKVQWQSDDRDPSKTIAIEISSITKQQQAPGKPMLRILSSAADPLALAFPSVEDKNEVLDFMKQLRPPGQAPTTVPTQAAPSAGVPTEAQKRQIFAANKDLAAIYARLVPVGILTESDFWRTHKREVSRFMGSISGGGAPAVRPGGRVGLSSVMHEVERLHDGTTERVSIHLTPKDVEKIFVERPEVHRAFLAHVPHAMNESDFWQRYFKLEYKKAARRKRLAAQGRLDVTDAELEDSDDLFAPFRRQLAEEEGWAARAKMKLVDPTVNLAAQLADEFSSDGFGCARRGAADVALPRMTPSFPGTNTAEALGLGGERVAQGHATALDSIARELNRHAAQVLEGTPEGLDAVMQSNSGGGSADAGAGAGARGPSSDSAAIAARVAAAMKQKSESAATLKGATLPAGATSSSSATVAGVVSEERRKEWQQRAASALEDLSLESEPQGEPLRIADPRSYFATAPTLTQGGGGGGTEERRGDVGAVAAGANRGDEAMGDGEAGGTVGDWNFLGTTVDASELSDPPFDPEMASNALLEACREDDGGLAAEFGSVAAAALGNDPNKALTQVMLEYFRMEALRTNELLRHFWGCMPAVTDTRRTKAARLATHLGQLRTELAAHCLSRSGGAQAQGTGALSLSAAQQVLVTQMVRPLVEAVDAALHRFDEVGSAHG